MKLTLPTDLEKQGWVCFYGFAVTMEWLVDYTQLHWNDADQYDNLGKASATMKLLRRSSHINTLEFKLALVDSTVPPETILTPGHQCGEPMVLLMAICGNKKPLYKKWPSQAEVDTLSQIIGGKQLRWWVDYEDPWWYEG